MIRKSIEIKAQISSLIELSLKSLANLFDEGQGLFSRYIKDGKRIPMPLTWSICYSAITLLGINKALNEGWQGASFLDQRKALYSLVSNWKRAKRFGHLGLIQWVNAECNGPYSLDIASEIEKWSSIDNLARLPTTELSWMLAGFCATYQRLSLDERIKELATLYYKTISNNLNLHTGLFSHTQKKNGLFDLRSNIGNFADQIYAIYALSSYYEVFNEKRAMQEALQCAYRLCSLQGTHGQWNWHYDSNSGIVVSRYPVFAVHQDGMGPMGLQKLADVSGKDFRLPILSGINWLFSSNELGVEMVDWESHVIWRDIERKLPADMARYVSILLAEAHLTKFFPLSESSKYLKINYEMRPYELGWLLYALPQIIVDI
jgi:hypothetical protein